MNINDFINELKKINIDVSDKQLSQLEQYYQLLVEYNEKMNLTGIVEKNQVYLKHFYDSLTLNKAIDLNNIETMCDIGSGAGFPGIVIKILFPKIKITLVDSLNKRVKFLNDTIKELELKEIEAVCLRAEEYSICNVEKYDLVTARAVASLNILIECSIQLVKINGYFIAMKGNFEEKVDISQISSKLQVNLEKTLEFTLPIEKSKRTLLIFKKKGHTSSKYPRKYSEIKHNPL